VTPIVTELDLVLYQPRVYIIKLAGSLKGPQAIPHNSLHG